MTLVCKFVVAIVGVTSADAISGNDCSANSTLVWDPVTNSTQEADPSAVPCGGGPSGFWRYVPYFCLITTCTIKVYDTYNFYFNELPAVQQTDDVCSDYAEFWSGSCVRNKNKDNGGLAAPLAD